MNINEFSARFVWAQAALLQCRVRKLNVTLVGVAVSSQKVDDVLFWLLVFLYLLTTA